MVTQRPALPLQAAQFSLFRDKMFIDGAWLGADDGQTLPVHNPATGEVIGSIPKAGADETHRAIAAAAKAFPAWRATTAAERAAKLFKLADLLTQNVDELALLLTIEQGKPLAEAKGEIGGSAAYVRWFAEEARRLYGDVIPSPWPGRRLMVTREPVGVCAAITPWNFPSSMLARKIGAALAAGCTVVCKPSELTPYSGLAWGVLAEQAGIPAGVVNIVLGDAVAIGGEMTSNPTVKKVTFTGSTPVGKLLMQQSAATMKKISMELGGNAPFLVFDDADLDAALDGAMIAKMRNAGEACTAANRFYVQSGIHDAFVAGLAARMAALKVGPGTDPASQVGPMITPRAVQKIDRLVTQAVNLGARLVTGGTPLPGSGYYYPPTVLADVSPQAEIAHEEIFGPVAPVYRFDTEDQAIALANETEYGLAAYVYSRDLSRALRVGKGIETGMVAINRGLMSDPAAPFGGAKQSGLGREGGVTGILEFMEPKYFAVNF